jgi:protease-4
MSIAELPPVSGSIQIAPSDTAPSPAAADPSAGAPGAAAATIAPSAGDGPAPVPPKWGGADDAGQRAGERPRSAGFAGPDLRLNLEPGDSAPPGAPGGAAGGGPGGAWLWLPRGVAPRRSWPRRHPILTFLGIFLVGALVFYFGRLSLQDSPISGPKLALIKVEGVILDSGPVVEFIEEIARDDSIMGALLRDNSPGGAVGPSQEIYAALKRLQKKKPLVASMGAVAASGGYYAAIAADKVYAGPSTLTASIGVKMSVPNMEGLMKTLGLSEKTLRTGELKDAGSSWRPMSAEEESYLQGLLDDMYEEVLAVVAKERSMSQDHLRPLADGRAMTGRQALVAGLVDRMGDATDALAELKFLCKMDENAVVTLVEGPEEPSSFMRDVVLSLFRAAMREKLAAEQPLFLYR